MVKSFGELPQVAPVLAGSILCERRWHLLSISTTILIFLINATGCKKSEMTDFKTTSDLVSEYHYTVRGRVEIDARVEIHQAAHLFDLVRKLRDFASNPQALADIKHQLENRSAFIQSYHDQVGQYFPPSEANAIYWIQQHFNFNTQILLKRKIMASMRRVMAARITKTKNAYQIEYEVLMRASADLANVNTFEEVEVSSPLAIGEILPMPRNLPGTFMHRWPKQAKVDLLSLANVINNQDFHLDDWITDISNTLQKLENYKIDPRCFNLDGDPVAPANFFFYFDPEKCGEDLEESQIVTMNKAPQKTTYPEYDQLFLDKKVEIFGYYGLVSGQTYAPNFVDRLKRMGFSILEKEDDHLTRLNQWINGIEFRVTIFAESAAKTTKVDVANAWDDFRAGIKNSEIFIYNGHSHYGEINKALAEGESYPKNRYQILMLNSCWSYRYSLDNVLVAKILKDADFRASSIDVIATAHEAFGDARHEMTFLGTIFKATKFYRLKKELAQMQSKPYTWLSIITAINAHQGISGGVYLVSGEEENAYYPGKTDGIPPEFSGRLDEYLSSRNPNIKRAASIALIGQTVKDSIIEPEEIQKIYGACKKHKLKLASFTNECKGIELPPGDKNLTLVFPDGERALVDGRKEVKLSNDYKNLTFTLRQPMVTSVGNGRLKIKDTAWKWNNHFAMLTPAETKSIDYRFNRGIVLVDFQKGVSNKGEFFSSQGGLVDYDGLGVKQIKDVQISSFDGHSIDSMEFKQPLEICFNEMCLDFEMIRLKPYGRIFFGRTKGKITFRDRGHVLTAKDAAVWFKRRGSFQIENMEQVDSPRTGQIDQNHMPTEFKFCFAGANCYKLTSVSFNDNHRPTIKSVSIMQANGDLTISPDLMVSISKDGRLRVTFNKQGKIESITSAAKKIRMKKNGKLHQFDNPKSVFRSIEIP